MKGLLLTLLLAWPCAAIGQSSPADAARAASEQLDAAAAQLKDAQQARDRVRALTATVRAFEAGLSALRDGVRQASLQEAEIAARLQSQEKEIASMLAALMRLGGTTSPVILLHPAGPAGTVRAGMLVSEMAPVLNQRADVLRRDLQELQDLQTLQRTSTERLETGLLAVQEARADLNQAIADRIDLPKSFVADPVREAILLSSVDTLDGFAAGLDQISGSIAAPPSETSLSAQAKLDLPAQGLIRRKSGEADAAGIARPGIIIATPAGALVTSPVNATLRYAGPLLDFGQVVILEPQNGVLFVFAGLETNYAATGDIVKAGAPLGLMGGADHKSAISLSTDGDETGAGPTETLYIEVRKNNNPENPLLWFRADKDG